MERRRCRRLNLSRPKSHFLIYCFSLFFFSVCALFSIISSTATTCQQDIRSSIMSTGQAVDSIHFHQENTEKSRKNGDEEEEKTGCNNMEGVLLPLSLARRFLGGLGSSPPRCMSKCGNCTPCKPVHVPVPPGTPVTAEYYPEAWRCKCGNKLYMP